MKSDNVTMGNSSIEGKGIFAARDFKKGEGVLKWDTSHTLTEQETKSLKSEEKRYITFLNNTYILMQPPERYVNHSCEPNTYTEDFTDIATRNITKGEEITTDYAKDSPPGFQMDCHCGSKNCRKTIRTKT